MSASAGTAEDRFHVDPRDLSQTPSQGNYLEHAEHLTRFAMIYVALYTGNMIRDAHIGLLLINFTLILPLDTFQYNIGSPDDWKLIALHGGKLKFQQIKNMEPSLRCFKKIFPPLSAGAHSKVGRSHTI